MYKHEPPSHNLILKTFGPIKDDMELEFDKCILNDNKEWVCLVSEFCKPHAEYYLLFFTYDLKYINKFKIHSRLVYELATFGKFAIVIHDQPDGLSISVSIYESKGVYGLVQQCATYTLFIYNTKYRFGNSKMIRDNNNLIINIQTYGKNISTHLSIYDNNVHVIKRTEEIETTPQISNHKVSYTKSLYLFFYP